VLYKLGLDSTAAYSFCAFATLLAFTLTRVLLAPLCFASLLRSRAQWGDDILLFNALLAICAFFVVLNCVWWTKLMKRAIKLVLGGGKSSAPRGGAPAGATPGKKSS
jgi:hypothetical protein